MNCVSKVKIFYFLKIISKRKKEKEDERKMLLSIGYIVCMGDRKVYS